MDGAHGRAVAYGLLERSTNQLLCSHCLAAGRRTPVPQVISTRHRPRSLCASCREILAGPALKSRLDGLVSLLSRRRTSRE